MEMNPVPVIAVERDLLQIITAITVAVAAAAVRQFPYCILDLRINSSKLAHLARPEIYLMAESLKQVLLHLFFLPSSHHTDCGIVYFYPFILQRRKQVHIGHGSSKCQLRLDTGLTIPCTVLSSLYIALSHPTLLFLFVISVICELGEGETVRK